MEMQVAVVGAGSWGTTVAHLSAHNVATTLYSRRDDVTQAINAQPREPQVLAGIPTPPVSARLKRLSCGGVRR